jgi:nucleotide-binding universal stress UspA family protein
MLVPPGAPHALPGDRPPVILVPLDGSELAEAALTPASELAVRLGAEVALLRVVSLPTYGVYAEAGEYLPFDPDAEVMDAQRYLADVAGRLRPAVGQVRVRADVGYPAPFIAQAALEEKADLIYMATHGRSGVARLVLGSVATDVLRRTNVPLVVVRPTPLREPTPPAAAAPEASAEVAPTGPVIQAPLSIGELRLLQRGLGELLYKPGGDPDLAPRVRELRDRLGRMERAAAAETAVAQH